MQGPKPIAIGHAFKQIERVASLFRTSATISSVELYGPIYCAGAVTLIVPPGAGAGAGLGAGAGPAGPGPGSEAPALPTVSF